MAALLPYREPEPNVAEETPASTWARLYARSEYVRHRAKVNSALTLPEVYPEENSSDLMSGQHSYQSLGSRGMNCFVNKVAVALFRPSTSFFRLRPTKKFLRKYLENNPSETEATLDTYLAKQEREAADAWTQKGEHHKINMALSHIAIIGQACLWFDEDMDSLRVIPFSQYCIARTATGKIDTLIIAEQLSVKDLHGDLQDYLMTRPGYNIGSPVQVYTRASRQLDGTYLVEVGVDDYMAPELFTRKYKENDLPFAVPFWKLPDGASYGVSMVDGLQGDLLAYNEISKALVSGSLALMDWRLLVNPGGQTNIDDLKRSNPGEAVPGLPGDIGMSLQGDPNVLQYVQGLAQQLDRRLSSAFLLDQGVFREGERVTATEIQRVVQSLEEQYSGIYAAIAHEFQAPLARWVLKSSGIKLDNSIQVSIVTGFDAISRQNDVSNLTQALAVLGQLQQLPPPLLDRLNWHTIAASVGDGFGIGLENFLIPEDQYQQQIQQQQQQQAALQVAAQQATQQPLQQ